MDNAEVKVFEIEGLRRKIFEYVYLLPSCKYCYDNVLNNTSSAFNDAICDSCIDFFI
tara:strand:- start:6110 stop:6280 length:171 start_codon:yes stop_codon:yes gene_type:complete